jgi:hypothetical protein
MKSFYDGTLFYRLAKKHAWNCRGVGVVRAKPI